MCFGAHTWVPGFTTSLGDYLTAIACVSSPFTGSEREPRRVPILAAARRRILGACLRYLTRLSIRALPRILWSLASSAFATTRALRSCTTEMAWEPLKGIGELGICGAGAALANAVYNACGVRVREYPITLEKVLAGLAA